MNKIMTRSQLKIYKYIKLFILLNGYSPTIREIGKGVGLSSTATVQQHLCNLKERGYINFKKDKARTITIK